MDVTPEAAAKFDKDELCESLERKPSSEESQPWTADDSPNVETNAFGGDSDFEQESISGDVYDKR